VTIEITKVPNEMSLHSCVYHVSALKMEIVGSYQTVLRLYQVTRRHLP